MSEFGRGGVATGAQRAEVRGLRAGGMSIRAIAARVFGDAGCRGRVERILRAAEADAEPPATEPLEEVDFGALGTREKLRLLFERKLQSWCEGGKAPSMSELRGAVGGDRRLAGLGDPAKQRPS